MRKASRFFLFALFAMPPHEAQGESAVPESDEFAISEPNGPVRHFSVHGYRARKLRVQRTLASDSYTHEVIVAFPAGKTNSAGQPSQVARSIDEGWFRAIENTFARIPWQHVKLVKRLVIDNRPTEHGIAAYDRNSPDDARDGHTIWLHEQLFREPNHWARGNYGAYFSYHVDSGTGTLDNLPKDHERFSPVLLHEIGHLVMYHLVNTGADRLSAPLCARTCADDGDCQRFSAQEREARCISPYCAPFRFRSSTENWAEQYRFYYQSSETRTLLEKAPVGCFAVLAATNAFRGESHVDPWKQGLPDSSGFRRSVWDSCGGRACKAW